MKRVQTVLDRHWLPAADGFYALKSKKPAYILQFNLPHHEMGGAYVVSELKDGSPALHFFLRRDILPDRRGPFPRVKNLDKLKPLLTGDEAARIIAELHEKAFPE